ncbi:LysM peptidoglycan-binding domain-containing protein [Paenibacillus piri]|uniref:LysM peptidoglycan-binding domain-containing protein n=2 Tax=Paenibacillus piri TaxID=2547395 RepID=A0A4R5KV65_9BACL|nr:LysM peptidoglycan-binding domain-containing protein [Paenibacillus piri]
MIGGEKDAFAASSPTANQSVEIVMGDTLWSIAGQHVHKGQDVREYINELKKLNGLKSNILQEGQVLLLP